MLSLSFSCFFIIYFFGIDLSTNIFFSIVKTNLIMISRKFSPRFFFARKFFSKVFFSIVRIGKVDNGKFQLVLKILSVL